MILRVLMVLYASAISLSASADNCRIPKNLIPYSQNVSQQYLLENRDTQRNLDQLKSLCIHKISLTEGPYHWQMLLVYNPDHPRGPFWFLPHDNEESAFDSAVYAARKYGGGFLAVLSGGKRYFNGQDPNRNFGEERQTATACRQQKSPAPLYSRLVFSIIDTYRGRGMPYLALHSNSDGWSGNGGQGTISILKSSASVHSYPSGKVLVGKSKGLRDEDSLIYIAGTQASPPQRKLKKLMGLGIHTKYEVVNEANNDCSMSNYVVLNRGGDYYNIETEHGDSTSQKIIINKLMGMLGIPPLASAPASRKRDALPSLF